MHFSTILSSLLLLTGTKSQLLVPESPPLPTTFATLQSVKPRDVIETVTVTKYPTPQPPDSKLAGCEKEFLWGWPKNMIRTDRAVNTCYPKLAHTCERDALVAKAKHKDFCSWPGHGSSKNGYCDLKKNKPLACPTCDKNDPIFRIPSPERCCPEPWVGMDMNRYNMKDYLCKMFRSRNEDEWDFYTQTWPHWEVYSQRFPFDNLTIEGYNFETGERLMVE
ncbi:hypothetical protein LTR67_005403 [Exophiala xenobiotica]